jgi:hypothetical protein
MFGTSKPKDWRTELVPELSGAFNGLKVTLRNFPCLFDSDSNTRKYLYPDFGFEFITELSEEQLGDYENVIRVLNSGASKIVYVRVRGIPPIEVSVKGTPVKRKAQFYSDIADALIGAFDSKGIKP